MTIAVEIVPKGGDDRCNNCKKQELKCAYPSEERLALNSFSHNRLRRISSNEGIHLRDGRFYIPKQLFDSICPLRQSAYIEYTAKRLYGVYATLDVNQGLAYQICRRAASLVPISFSRRPNVLGGLGVFAPLGVCFSYNSGRGLQVIQLFLPSVQLLAWRLSRSVITAHPIFCMTNSASQCESQVILPLGGRRLVEMPRLRRVECRRLSIGVRFERNCDKEAALAYTRQDIAQKLASSVKEKLVPLLDVLYL